MDFGLTQNKTTSTKPWKQQRKELIKIFHDARKLYLEGPQRYYPGDTVAGFNGIQKQAFQLGRQRALNGNETVNNAEDFTNRMLNGNMPQGNKAAMDFYRSTVNGNGPGTNKTAAGVFRDFANSTGPNTDQMTNRFTKDVLQGDYSKDPYLTGVYRQIENRVLPSVNSTFSAAGRYGSNAHQDSAASALSREFAPVAEQMYQTGIDRMERAANQRDQVFQNDKTRQLQGASALDNVFQNQQGRQMSAANNLQQAFDNSMGRQERAADRSFQFGAEDWRNLAQLEGIGQRRQQQNQRVLDDRKARWDFEQNAPWDNLGRYNAMVQGNYGGSQSYQAPSTFASMLGLGMSAVPLLGGFL